LQDKTVVRVCQMRLLVAGVNVGKFVDAAIYLGWGYRLLGEGESCVALSTLHY
jgi:hypothetical protein